jgi:hypothetical protein
MVKCVHVLVKRMTCLSSQSFGAEALMSCLSERGAHANPDREDRIRQRAHDIWLGEGCPEGRADVHWRQALAEEEGLASETALSDGLKATGQPPARPRPHVSSLILLIAAAALTSWLLLNRHDPGSRG